jgi:hypothetical protein
MLSTGSIGCLRSTLAGDQPRHHVLKPAPARHRLDEEIQLPAWPLTIADAVAEFADAVLGRFKKDKEQFIAVVEGKDTRDPLGPFAGRRMSAVDQAYRYAINFPCDWIIVTSMRETRLQYERACKKQIPMCSLRSLTCLQAQILPRQWTRLHQAVKITPQFRLA